MPLLALIVTVAQAALPMGATGPSGSANQPEPAPVVLTYAEALARAGQSAASVRSASADLAAAEAAALAARAPFEPTLSASGSYFSSTNEGAGQFGRYFAETSGWSSAIGLAGALPSGTTVGVDFDASQNRFLYRLADSDAEFTDDPQYASSLALRVSQSLLQGHRLAYNLRGVRAADAGRSIAELMRIATRQQARADTARAFWQARYQRALVDVAEQTLALAREQRRATAVLVENGRLAPVEGTRAEASEVQAERAALEARAAAAAADDALLVLVGASPGAPLQLVIPTIGAPPAASLDADAIVAAVLAGNPQLRAARATVEQREQAVKDARHALLPQLSATASGALRGFEPSLGASVAELGSATLADWNVGGTLSLPLANRADRAAVATAEAEAERARIAVRQTEDTLATQARAQVRALDTAARDVELARLNVRLAESTLAAESARLAEGRSLQRDVSEALRQLDTARADAERATTAWAVALVELDRLKGTLE